MKKMLLVAVLCCAINLFSREKGVVIVGLGERDEGKGKVIQYIVKSGDISVRSQGACSFGHTVKLQLEVCSACSTAKKEHVSQAPKKQMEVTLMLQMVPVGIVETGVKCYMTGGMFIDPVKLFEEVDLLEKYGIYLDDTLRISSNVHLIFPYHQELDRLMHERNKTRIKDDVVLTGARSSAAFKRCGMGIRLGDLMSPEFPKLLKKVLDYANDIIVKVHGGTPLDYQKMYTQYALYIPRFKPFVRDRVELKINKLLLTDHRVIFEGTHGTFLDISHGCYPAVSAESTTASGICAAAGVGPTRIAHTLGVAKAYATHLGDGPFPTEIKKPALIAHFAGKAGGSCDSPNIKYGWIDIVQIRQAALLNGVNSVALTRLDDLDGLDEIKICTHYELDGKPIYDVPPQISDLKRVVPKYHTIKGWKRSLKDCKKFTDLPPEARNFVKTFEHVAGVVVSYVSVGPEKHQMIELVSNLLPRPTC